MPDNESTEIDTAAITEAIRRSIKDLDAETERINASCEALPRQSTEQRLRFD